MKVAGTSIFAGTPSMFESLELKLIFIVNHYNISLGPGCVVGGKGKKRDETGR